MAAVAATATSCSVIVNTTADQCKATPDCAKFPGTTCQEGVCVGAPCKTGADCASGVCTNGACVTPSGCQSNAECLTMDDYHVCRKFNGVGTCVGLLSSECTTVFGDYKDDNAILLGSILPTAGPDQSTGAALENSIKLAINDFKQTSNGLPPAPGQTAHRPLALVGCNDNSDSDTAIKAAKHLAEEVHVPAIIGAAFSGITIKVATSVTVADQVMLFSPSATSVAITDLQDNDLVWRSSPSDIFQAQAIALLAPQIEATVRSERMLMPGESIKVAIIHKGDAYGAGLGKALEQQLVFNGKPALDMANGPYYFRADYGDPDDQMANPTKYPQVQQQVLMAKPDIIFDFGTNESVTNLMVPIETQWATSQPSVMYDAHYVFSDGGLINELWNAVGGNDGLRTRILGTVPGTTNALFAAFKSEYKTQFTDGTSPDVFGTAGSYDIVYLLAYASVGLGAQPITGPNLVAGMAKLVQPMMGQAATIPVGADKINSTFPILSAGQNIDYDGASGPLDFDLKTGEAPSDIQVWCMPKDMSGKAQPGIGSGLYFNAKTSKLEGSPASYCN